MRDLTFDEYQEKALRTCNLQKPNALLTLTLGLCGEAGEVAENVKKHAEGRRELNIDEIDQELGDVLWYWVNLCTLLKRDPANVAERNIQKLEKRYPDGMPSFEKTDLRSRMFREGGMKS